MPGAGKSYISKILSDKYNITLLELDEIIEHKYNNYRYGKNPDFQKHLNINTLLGDFNTIDKTMKVEAVNNVEEVNMQIDDSNICEKLKYKKIKFIFNIKESKKITKKRSKKIRKKIKKKLKKEKQKNEKTRKREKQ